MVEKGAKLLGVGAGGLGVVVGAATLAAATVVALVVTIAVVVEAAKVVVSTSAGSVVVSLSLGSAFGAAQCKSRARTVQHKKLDLFIADASAKIRTRLDNL